MQDNLKQVENNVLKLLERLVNLTKWRSQQNVDEAADNPFQIHSGNSM